ncbi:MAG TPA: YihY/virulence factor BrkB family protein [Gaiellales bacterium]|nr:YihY/virulence factor BrkB family protein [Gaiellales bacterium]
MATHEEHSTRTKDTTNGTGDEPLTPQPEVVESRLRDPGLSDLSKRDYLAIVQRGIKSGLKDNVTNLAQAVAYCAFLAIPSAMLVGLGLFSVLAGPSTVNSLLARLSTVLPASVISLLDQSLTRSTQAHSGGIVMIVVGVLFALWSLSGAMQTVMWAMNMAYEREETRGFVKKRLIALAMILCCVVAFALVFVALILGPFMTDWIGRAVGNTTLVTWVWWTVQWPILIVALMAMFAAVLWLAPNVSPRRWSFITPGAVFAVVVWLIASAAFAFYASGFASYNKAWGSLSAVIVMLTWLWLSALALLMGGEINAEAERSRELRQGEPAQTQIQAPEQN